MTFGQRFLLMLFIVLVILFALAAFGYFTDGWEDDPEPALVRWGMASAESRPELCMDGDTRERVRKLMIEALDDGLKQKIEDLFAVWLRDTTGQPARASNGMRTALRAYVDARASAMKFNPPECPG